MSRPYVSDPQLTEWLWRKIGSYPPICVSVGWKDDAGNPIGGFLIQSYTGDGGSCRTHFAGERGWITRGRLRIMAGYLFNFLGCTRVYGEVAASDTDTIELDKRIGFRELVRLPGYFAGGEDCVLLEMTRENCRWLRSEDTNGQEVRRSQGAETRGDARAHAGAV